jgi:hypothetical protein
MAPLLKKLTINDHTFLKGSESRFQQVHSPPILRLLTGTHGWVRKAWHIQTTEDPSATKRKEALMERAAQR